MYRTKQKLSLRDAELAFIAKLDKLTYSDSAACKKAPHYMLIEGVIGANEVRATFIVSRLIKEPCIIINGSFPKREQKLTITQFYEWLNNPSKQQTAFMQDQNFELSEALKMDIKNQFKNLRDGRNFI